jgi:DNA-binding IclR family transcriptional regulator
LGRARTLQSDGCPEHKKDTGYRHGLRRRLLAARAVDDIEPVRKTLRTADPTAAETAGAFPVTGSAGHAAVCLDAIPSRRAIASVAHAGSVRPPHAVSGGLALPAENDALRGGRLPEPQDSSASSVPQTLTDPDEPRAALAQVRQTPYAVVAAFLSARAYARGAPVHESPTRAVEALSVMPPSFRPRGPRRSTPAASSAQRPGRRAGSPAVKAPAFSLAEKRIGTVNPRRPRSQRTGGYLLPDSHYIL